LVVEALSTGRWALRCQRTAPLASMTTAVRAPTLGAVGAAAAGVAVKQASRPSTARPSKAGDRRGRKRTPVGCTNRWMGCNVLDPDELPGRRAATGAAAG
jgi:hypothetical protein